LTQAEQHTVVADAPRLDQYLAGLLAGESRSQVQRLIAQGHVRLNDGPARPGSRLRAGDRLSWELPAPTPSRLEAEPMDLRVLYEDEDLVVIDKPAGLVVHPGPGHPTGTLVHGLLGRGPAWSTIGGTERPGIVHRLDRDTSGLMVVARNDEAHRELARQLQQRVMTRRYRAIVVGEVADQAARIEAPIGRDRKHRQRMAVVAGGREAITEFRRLVVAGGHSVLDVSLGTGRTHQIRVHLAYIKHPVLGDPVYGRRSPLIDRPALHAHALTLRHPRTGKTMSFESPPPEDFELAWNSLSQRKMPNR
jgi:23S rRNA pseudouridine1911/1915/1917 synthase